MQSRWPTGFSCPLRSWRPLPASQQAAHDLPVQRLPPADLADRRNLVPRLQPAPDDVVPGHLPSQPGQDRPVRPGLEAALGVSYPTAWLIHHKLMQAMAEREDRYRLSGAVQMDDAYLGGERSGGLRGRRGTSRLRQADPVARLHYRGDHRLVEQPPQSRLHRDFRRAGLLWRCQRRRAASIFPS